MKKIFIIIGALIFLLISYVNGQEKSKGLFDIGGGLAESRDYYENGKLKQVVTWDYKTGKPHGEKKIYDKNGNLIKSEWFVYGELKSKEDFLKTRNKKAVTLSNTESQKNEGNKIDNFVNELTKAWQKKDNIYCKNLIEKTLNENPNWIPGNLASFGYFLWVDPNIEKAKSISEKIKDLVDENAKDTNVKDVKKLQSIVGLLPVYINLIEKDVKEGKKSEHGFGNIFPASELIFMYAASKEIKLSTQESFISDVKKRMEKDKN